MGEENNRTIHFSFSPVQAFVSQARRTRDLWVGSFLLSWLSGHAMLALGKSNIAMPNVENDALIAAIESGRPNGTIIEIGSLPNRFVAKLPNDKTGKACEEALNNAWDKVANEVLSHINKTATLIQSETGSIWDRQVKRFWELHWVVGEEGYRLEQRKNLRTHLHSEEPGEKCTVCGERQELSGITDPEKIRTEIKDWWKKNLIDTKKIHLLDLRESERLCAICLIKRAIPFASQNIFRWQIDQFYPSTAYMAAVDWLIYMLRIAKTNKEVRNAANDFVQTANQYLERKYQVSERSTKILGVEKALEDSGVVEGIAFLDGDVFFLESLRGEELELKEEGKEALIKQLNQLHKALQTARENNFGQNSKPSPFYALLMMDGDGMGKLLSDRTSHERRQISEALADFAVDVPAIVKECNGKLIYAGGDDVFALLPIDQAINCAKQCRSAYQRAFEHRASFVDSKFATISAAINYAHMNTALGVVVRDSHRLLDDIAKKKTGRNAIACRVWKRGGPILTWSQPWIVAENGDLINRVKESFLNNTNEPDKISSKFLYKLHDLFELVQDGDGKLLMDIDDIQNLLVTEYIAIREHNWQSEVTQENKRKIALARIQPIMKLCRETIREITTDQRNGETCLVETYCASAFKVDGAMLIRFLAQKEI